MNHKRLTLSSATLLVCVSGVAMAGGPLLVFDELGTPYRWSQNEPVEYHTDKGPLGPMSNSAAKTLTAQAFGHFSEIESADLDIISAGDLPTDVNGDNFSDYVQKCDGRSPVIFDHDGRVTDGMLGAGASCLLLGFAGPECISTSQPTILEGLAVINGLPLDENGPCPIPDSGLELTMAHEFGHFLNLSHSQINGNHALYREPVVGFEEAGIPPLDAVELMYPVLILGERNTILTHEEISWFSWLYPRDDGDILPTIVGDMLDESGQDYIPGVNIVARPADNPHFGAVSAVSGFLWREKDWPESLKGAFELPILDDEAGYIITAEEVNQLFVGSSSLPPTSPPLDLVPEEDAAFLEFYNDRWEAGNYPPDDPFDRQAVYLDGLADHPLEIWLNYDLEPDTISCDGADQCGPGWDCLDGYCQQLCTVDADCASGYFCDAGICMEGSVFDPGDGNPVDGGTDITPTPTPVEGEGPVSTPTQAPGDTGSDATPTEWDSSPGYDDIELPGCECNAVAAKPQNRWRFASEAAALLLLASAGRRRRKKKKKAPKAPFNGR